MKVGLVGFPGSGKTTVFNALTGLSAETGFGAARGKTNLGTVKVPDDRVKALAGLYRPKKTTLAEIGKRLGRKALEEVAHIVRPKPTSRTDFMCFIELIAWSHIDASANCHTVPHPV